MDLGTIQDAFADFATFGKNIGKAFQGIPDNVSLFVNFFQNFETLSSTTETAGEGVEESGSTLLGSSND
ncbi:MAG: PorH family porin [Corynebacterium sp.]|uniref:PorH family porin n=1 Tax=Corynebacterium sp. TaxID=1720 RepID=UPI0026E0ABC9|nr:PorH family porin [Corynebacterium sp.]MDO5669379.1 PorH family porin [Corynebacterium sp.]